MKKPQVLLLYPKTGMDFGSTIAPPHAMLAIGAPLDNEGYEVKIIDQRVEPVTEKTISQYLSDDLICIGISTMTGTQIKNALNMAKMARNVAGKDIPLVWGGTHPTVLPEQTLEHELVDIVCIGEGDITFLETVKAIQNGTPLDDVQGIIFEREGRQIKTEARPMMDVEELLPVPWHLVDAENYIHQDMYVQGVERVMDIGQTSRGCPFKCSFCSSSCIRGRKWRAMSAKKSLDMILGTIRKFNLGGFWLRDDEFYIDRNRAHEIFLGIIESGLDVQFYTSGTRVDVFLKATDEQLMAMKNAGAHTLKFGAESGSKKVLDIMQKGITPEMTQEVNRRCRDLGINASFGLIVGFPGETFDDIRQTIDFGYGLKRENPTANLETMAQFTPLPGTPSFESSKELGLVPPASLEGWTEWLFDDYDFEGKKLPWLSRRKRIAVGNISYMSILANGFVNALESVRNPLLRNFFRFMAKPASKYFKWRLLNGYFWNVPELIIVRYLRRKLFYESDTTMIK